MLSNLIIKNFALIEYVNLNFKSGFNVITGETGAGKSILIDAINVLLGAQGKEDYIRKGAESTTIIGIFNLNAIQKDIISFLKDNDIEIINNEIIIKRVLKPNNNRVYINDEPVTVSLLNKVTSLLVDIHGQHEHQTLFDISKHLNLVNTYAGLKEKLTDYKNDFLNLKSLQNEMIECEQELKFINEKKDIYEFQLNEIKSAKIIKNEDEVLENKLCKYRKLHKLNEYLQKMSLLIDSDNDIIYNLEKLSQYISDISNIDASFNQFLSNCEEALIQIRDFKDFYDDYTDSLDIDPLQIERYESRAYKLQLLKKKYGPSLEDVIQYYNNIKEKYTRLLNSDSDLKELRYKIDTYTNTVRKKAQNISTIRKKTAKTISKKITSEIKKLNMEDAEFDIIFNNLENFTETGIDRVEFYVKTNRGEDFKPLKKIASGGELSRIMLAIKSVFAHADAIPVLIFDEIDTGISGKTGQSIADAIYKLALNHQVFCITHLPVLASAARTHFSVYKKSDKTRTITEAKKLNYEERIQELAYLMSGGNITPTSITHAKELLKKK